MYRKRVLKIQKSPREIPNWMTLTISNSMLSIGAILVVAALIYLLVNLDKSDSMFVIQLPIIVAGIALVFISQMIMPGLPRLRRRKGQEINSTHL